MAGGEELLVLIENEIPEGRKSLQENYMNLEKVAKYCEENYHKANPAEKARALQETRDFTTHSLASVAYQINNLATNFLKLLDLQHSQLTDMESDVNHLNQIVMIHKEKVARREIGVLTSGRSVPRPLGMKNGIIYPEQTERPIRYTRKAIDYNLLDDIGHGVKPAGQGSTPRAARSNSVSSNHSNSSSAAAYQAGNPNYHQAPPNTKPPTPPVHRPGSVAGGSQGGTIGRASGSQYRTPVAPPVAPSPLQGPGGNFPPGPHSSSRSSVSSGGAGSYSPSSTMGMIHSPPTAIPGMGHPGAHVTGGSVGGYSPSPSTLHSLTHSANPSLMHPDARVVYAGNNGNRGPSWIDNSNLPLPPPVDDEFPEPFMGDSPGASPLPPPPEMDPFGFPAHPPPQDFSDMSDMGPPSQRDGRMVGSVPEDTYAATQDLRDQGGDQYAATGPQLIAMSNDWIPQNYIEKVVAIFNYQANKSDELTFSENAVIYVIHKNDDGWWEGVMDGQQGLFPYNYVEPCM